MSSCPISGESIDENASRIVGVFVVAFVVVYLIHPWIGWLLILGFDFYARIYRCDWSPFRHLALLIRRRYVRPRLIDAAPKLFAARIGLLMVVAALGLHVVGWLGLAYSVSVILLIAALLESAIGFCVGCWMYGMVQMVRR